MRGPLLTEQFENFHLSYYEEKIGYLLFTITLVLPSLVLLSHYLQFDN